MRYFLIEPFFRGIKKAAASEDEKKGEEDDDDDEDVIMRVGTGVLSRRSVGSRINGRSVRVAGYMVIV